MMHEDPDYEVIEFGQQYSNGNIVAKKDTEMNCQLCGSTIPTIQCTQCEQLFCKSCDVMFHRHPKRQSHLRKQKHLNNVDAFRPPLPPKSAALIPPVPPPRKHKRAGSVGSTSSIANSSFGAPSTNISDRFNGISPASSHLPPHIIDNRRASVPQRFPSQTGGFPNGFSSPFNGNLSHSSSVMNLNSPHLQFGPSARNFGPFIQQTHPMGMPHLYNGNSCMQLNMMPNLNPMWMGTWHGGVANPLAQQPYSMAMLPGEGANLPPLPSKGTNEDGINVGERSIKPKPLRRSKTGYESDFDDAKSHRSYRSAHNRSYSLCNNDDRASICSRTMTKLRRYSGTGNTAQNDSAVRRARQASSSESDDESSDQLLSSDPDISSEIPDRWECEHCTYLNKSSSHICKMCCKTTTYKNLSDGVKSRRKRRGSFNSVDTTAVLTRSNSKSSVFSRNESCAVPKHQQGEIEVDNHFNRLWKSRTLGRERVFSNKWNDEQPAQGNDCVKKRSTAHHLRRNRSFHGSRYSIANSKDIECYPALSINSSTSPSQPLSHESSPVRNINPVEFARKRLSECKVGSPKSVQEHQNGIKDKCISAVDLLKSSCKDSQSNQETFGVFKSQGLELVNLLRKAEQYKYTADEVQVALKYCKNDDDPIQWLQSNWANKVASVRTLATQIGREAPINVVGTVSEEEAKAALVKHNAEFWPSVNECVEQRQQKYTDLASRGQFSREDILTVLTANHGDVELAFNELNKTQLKPFLMKIWGPPVGQDNDAGNLLQDELYHPDSLEDLTKPDDVAQPNQNPVIKGKLVRRLLVENRVDTYQQAEMANQLLNLKFSLDESLQAVKECPTLEAAVAYLQQLCELCAGRFTAKQMVSMLKCMHMCCQECAKQYFTTQITEKSIMDCICPFCKHPELTNSEMTEDDIFDYFTNLDVFLKSLVDDKVYELFQRKLRDRTLMKDPNFKWCIQCSSGFISNDHQTRVTCPDCKSVTCAKCRMPWEKQHEGISCEKFAAWKAANDPENQLIGVKQHLAENGIDCPKCKFRYVLSKGGCMHFTCTQCKHEFCFGCGKPFKMGANCTVSNYCAKLGLHAHHPRNCLFYLRDKKVSDLQALLKERKIPFKCNKRSRNGQKLAQTPEVTKCPIALQIETPDGLVDSICEKDTADGEAGLCGLHYIEYLVGLIGRNKLDPIDIFEMAEIMQELKRQNIEPPARSSKCTDIEYKAICIKIVKDQVPLE